MSIKSTNVKNYINEVGSKKQLFVFIGSNDSNAASESPINEIDLWKQSDFSIRLGQNSISAVVPNVKWIKSKPYTPWNSFAENQNNFYAYNDVNGYVYLCISDNFKNRKDLKDIVSTIRPTHTSGVQRYADGYAWRPLYKITPGMERFVTTKWIPVISFENYDDTPQQSQLSLAQNFCGGEGNTTIIGNCAIYSNIAISVDDDESTIEYNAGDLFMTAENVACSECYYLMKNNDNFTSVFFEDGETIPDTYVINDKFTKIQEYISSNLITTSSPYYHLYQCNINDNLEEGSIVSAFIDLSTFTQKQLTVGSSNPEISIISNTGTSGRIRFLTSIASNDNYVIDGIEVIATGSGYKDIYVDIPDGLLNPSLDKSALISAIEINLDKVDGIGFDPIDVLNCKNLMMDARAETSSIESEGIILPNSVNFFSLVENPVGISGSSQVISGSNLNKKLDYIFRTTTKATINYSRGGVSLETDDLVDITYTKNSTSKVNYNSKIGGVENVTTNVQTVELKNILYSDSDDLDAGLLDSTTKGAIITSIDDKPIFRQYTGKALSTTKLNNSIPVADGTSVIFRINMIKGF